MSMTMDRAAVDTSAWDGNAAMAACSSAADYNAICAGKRAGDPSLRSSHALPHHKSPGSAPNADGVRNALSRLPQTQGLTNAAAARSHLEAHLSTVQNANESSTLPKENIVRALFPGVELRETSNGNMPTMVGHFTPFNSWTRIDSVSEGTFMERIDPHAFDETFVEDRDAIRVTFNHGHDPSMGDKVLGPITELKADDTGAYYEVPLFDTTYNRDLLPGIKAGVYGASFRFSVGLDKFVDRPERSDYNPDGIPERTILSARVAEFGPVTFPAYADATAGVRSLTDEYVFEPLTRGEGLRRFADYVEMKNRAVQPFTELDPPEADDVMNCGHCGAGNENDAMYCDQCGYSLGAGRGNAEYSADAEDTAQCASCQKMNDPDAFFCDQCGTAIQSGDDNSVLHVSTENAAVQPETETATEEKPPEDQPPATQETKAKEATVADTEERLSPQQRVARIEELKSERNSIASEFTGVLPEDVQQRWDSASEVLVQLEKDERAYQDRMAVIEAQAKDPTKVIPGTAGGPVAPPNDRAKPLNPDIYDIARTRQDSRSEEDYANKLRDNAMRIVESKRAFPYPGSNTEDIQGKVGHLLDTVDAPAEGKETSELARRIIATDSPAYRRAFAKTLGGKMLTPEEQRAMSIGTTTAGGFAITFELDPTIVQTSNFSINPYRGVCRVVTISGTNEWRGVSAGAASAAYATEALEASDNTQTFAQPAFVTKRAQCFIPFSYEAQEDIPSLQSSLAQAIADAKDDLEATQFATGAGTTVFPQGMVTGATNTVNTGTTTVLAINDIYLTEQLLPPRWRPRAQWFANRFIYNKVRQFDTAGGASLWVPNFTIGLKNQPYGPAQGNLPNTLLGYPVNEASGMAATLATTTLLAVLGDPNQYVIVDRVGMNLELIPNLFGSGNRYPTGQRGLYAFWRNTARVFEAGAFATLRGV